MKNCLLAILIVAATLPSRAQLVLRNTGPDTMRVAVGTYYDTTKKALATKGWLTKPVIVRGWYWLYPGDSAVLGKFIGPAVYYRRETVRNNRYTLADPTSNNSYREWFYTPARRSLNDTSRFSVKHPVKGNPNTQQLVMDFFNVVLVPAETQKTGRFLIELRARPLD